MTDDGWLSHAMSDDAAVVEILMRLKRPSLSPSPALQLDWSVRQRRSRQVLRKKSEQTRASPTTPLSWSGATSGSGGGADGSEESSRPPSKPVESSRSKVSLTGETSTSKRSRKKKTLAELRDEEKLLLKEGRDLKDKIATLRMKVEEQRTRNERFKKFKRDVLPQKELQRMEVHSEDHHQYLTSDVGKASEIGIRESIFSLPDLNLPVEDDNNNGISGSGGVVVKPPSTGIIYDHTKNAVSRHRSHHRKTSHGSISLT